MNIVFSELQIMLILLQDEHVLDSFFQFQQGRGWWAFPPTPPGINGVSFPLRPLPSWPSDTLGPLKHTQHFTQVHTQMGSVCQLCLRVSDGVFASNAIVKLSSQMLSRGWSLSMCIFTFPLRSALAALVCFSGQCRCEGTHEWRLRLSEFLADSVIFLRVPCSSKFQMFYKWLSYNFSCIYLTPQKKEG